MDIKSFGVSKEPLVINFGNAIGSHDGIAYLANRHGLYKSVDKDLTAIVTSEYFKSWDMK